MTTDTLRGACPVPLAPFSFGPPRDVISDQERAHSFTSPIVLSEPAPAEPRHPAPVKVRPASTTRSPRTPTVRPGPPDRLTPAEAADVVRRYTAGQSRAQIARDLGRSETTALRYLKRAGIPLRNDRTRPVTPDDAADIIARYQAGESRESIGKAVRRADVTVNRIILNAGLALRNDAGGNRRSDPYDADALATRIRALLAVEPDMSRPRIAAELGVTKHVVRTVMEGHGIAGRTRTGWGPT